MSGPTRHWTLSAAAALAGLLLASANPSAAQEASVGGHRQHAVRTAGAPPLTVRRLHRRPVIVEAYVPDGPAFLRRWNDTRLYSFYGWRLGGDNFYGDQEGSPITRGNASLGAIAGYGPAMGGYGGPHFDSVGGFHDGPGPQAQEDEDYATGSVSRPDYGNIVPRYPSIRAQVALLNAGLAGSSELSGRRAAFARVNPE